jgi:hypothetical protein
MLTFLVIQLFLSTTNIAFAVFLKHKIISKILAKSISVVNRNSYSETVSLNFKPAIFHFLLSNIRLFRAHRPNALALCRNWGRLNIRRAAQNGNCSFYFRIRNSLTTLTPPE